MALLVDGDACPDLPAIRDLAWKYQVEMTVFVDYAHFIQDDYFRTILCDDNNIEELLMSRYVSAKQRKSGRRTRGPAKRTDEVRNQFLKQLDKILIQA